MNSENLFKELVYERWRHSERKCYFVMGANGTAIGYALITVDVHGNFSLAVATTIVLLIWGFGFYTGILSLNGIRAEIEEIHRNISSPAIENPRRKTDSPLTPSWTKERDKIHASQLYWDEFQLSCLIFGSLAFGLERLGWLSILKKLVTNS